MTTVADLEAEYDRLYMLVYSPEVRDAVTKIVDQCPDPSTLEDVDAKVRVLLLRGRARLLLPAFSKEAEADLNKALRLTQQKPQVWVALSEAYWKRNAIGEARDALDAALKLDAKNQPALCQLSRILRSQCALPDVPADEKVLLLTEAVAKAKDAVAVNPSDGTSWSVFGVALLQQTISKGMDMAMMQKSLTALNQAAQKKSNDPDIFYNRAVIHSCFGHYGSAYCDFMTAYNLDPKGLKGAKRNAESQLEILIKSNEKMSQPFAGLTERDFRKNIAGKLPELGTPVNLPKGMVFCLLGDVIDKAVKGEPKWVAFKTLDLLSSPTDQPLTYLCVDRSGSQCLLLLYRVQAQAIRIQDTVLVPFPPSSAANIGHDIKLLEGVEGTGKVYHTPQLIVEPTTLLVNGQTIPSKFMIMPQLSTRQFQ